MKKRNSSVNISVRKLHPHPENPRKDLGDIAELTESIRKNGIMQNLTVIPGYFNDNGVWIECDGTSADAEYTIIIGHRRFAAAKAAGFTEVPCRIYEDMSRDEQIGTMLEENMQRNDLTVFEQATSFQLMLDLGGSEDAICEKTGFSKKTVRHRLEIAKLNPTELKKKEQDESFQLTLTDLYELEKIKDVKVRNQILKESRSSSDLRWRAKTAAENEKADLNEKVIAAKLESMGVIKAPKKASTEQWSGIWETHASFDLSKDIDEIKITWKKTSKQLMYVRWYRFMHLIYPKEKQSEKKKTAEDLKREQRDKNIKAIKGMMKNLKNKREKFCYSIYTGETEPVKNTVGVMEQLWDIACDQSLWLSSYGIKQDYVAAWAYSGKDYSLDKAAEEILYVPHWKQLLLRVNDSINDSIVDYMGKYDVNIANRYIKFIDVLEMFGFYETSEERDLIEGKSDLFEKGK